MRETCKEKTKTVEMPEIVDTTDKQQIYAKLINEMREELAKIPDMQAQIDQLKRENNKLKVSKVSTSNVNNGMIHNGDVNVYVNVSAFGKEDMNKINKTELLRAFKSGFNSVLRLTETTHFNPKYPEFHNVYISSMKNKYAMTYDGTDWSLVMKDELIDKMYDKKRDYIEENMEEFIESLSTSQINALHRWLNADETHPYIAKIKNDMKLMLYNKRKMITNTKSEHNEYDKTNVGVKVIKIPKDNMFDSIEDIDQIEPVLIAKKKRIARRTGKHRKAIAKN